MMQILPLNPQLHHPISTPHRLLLQ
jgi:hypothetical protein